MFFALNFDFSRCDFRFLSNSIHNYVFNDEKKDFLNSKSLMVIYSLDIIFVYVYLFCTS